MSSHSTAIVPLRIRRTQVAAFALVLIAAMPHRTIAQSHKAHRPTAGTPPNSAVRTSVDPATLIGRWRVSFEHAGATGIFRADSTYVLYQVGKIDKRESLTGLVADTTSPSIVETGQWRLRTSSEGKALLCVRPTDGGSPFGFYTERCGTYEYKPNPGYVPFLLWVSEPRSAGFLRYDDTSADEVHLSLEEPTPRARASIDQPYFAFQVEKEATLRPGSPAPVHPESLRAANIEGEVLAQFVVDTLGRPDPSTFRVLKSSHELFAQSVRGALPAMSFAPAEVGGRKVPQLVQMPFSFSLSH